MSYQTERFIPSREKRTSALSHFNGTAAELNEQISGEISQRIRTFANAGQDEIIAVLSVISTIKNAAVIVHGASGCALCVSDLRANARIYSTNLTERETILGGDQKLFGAINDARKNRPEIIFIVGTPVTAISNDDIASVMLELEGETDAPMIFLKTDGFQTKTAVNGFDVLSHMLLRHIVKKSEKGDFVNLIAFSQSAADIAAITGILKELNVNYNLLPRFSDAEAIRKAGAAAASIALSPNEAYELAQGLCEDFDVPVIEAPAPIGIRATGEFLSALGGALGRESEFNAYLAQKEAAAELNAYRGSLKCKRVFFDLDSAEALSAARLVLELGGEIAGFSIPYADEQNRAQIELLAELSESASVTVGLTNAFEAANFFAGQSCGLYIGGRVSLVTGTSVAALYTGASQSLYGYDGMKSLAQAARQVPFKFGRTGYYRPEWLKKRGNWYVKREVK